MPARSLTPSLPPGLPPELVAEYLAQVPAVTPTEIDVYPENWLPMQVFDAMRTQWRIGLGGLFGLDYSIIPMMEKRFRIELEQSDDLFDALQVLEMETLKIRSERRDG